jgi:hydrogenase maturation protease
MPQVQVIGFGNPLREDDGLGWQAVGNLAEKPWSSEVRLETRHQLTPELAETLSKADLVIFIDARADAAPGRLSCEPMYPARGREGGFSHQLDIPSLLACAEDLFGRAPRAFLLSVGASSFGFGETLSKPVQAALPALLEEVERLLATAGHIPSPKSEIDGGPRGALFRNRNHQ